MELFKKTDEDLLKNNEEIETIESGREKFVTKEELIEVAREIKAKLNTKKTELEKYGLTMKDIIEESGLDYDFLSKLENPEDFTKELEGMDYNGLEEWKKTFYESIRDIGKVETPKDKNEILNIIKKYGKKGIKPVTLALYFGAGGALVDLAGHGVTMASAGENIPIDDLAENPEFKEAINSNRDIPIDVLQRFATTPLSNKEGFTINFAITENQKGETVIGANLMGTYDVQNNAKEIQDEFSKINDLLLGITEGHNFSNDAVANKMTMEEFENNKEKIVNELSSIMNIPKEQVSEHFEKLFEAVQNPNEKVSVVSMEDFEIDKDFQGKGEVQIKLEEIERKYDMNNPEEKTKAIKEFENWGKENGHDNVYSDLSKEKLDNPFAYLETKETPGVMSQEIYGKFITNELEEKGYNIDELKNNKEKAIDAIFEFCVERYGLEDNEGTKEALMISLEGWDKNGDNVNKALNGKALDYLPFAIENKENEKYDMENRNPNNSDENQKSLMSELIEKSLEKRGLDFEKLNEITKENPKNIIPIISDLVEEEFSRENGFNTEDQARLFIGIKNALTNMGIEGLDKFVAIDSVNEKGEIISKIIAVKDGKLLVTSIEFGSLTDGHGGETQTEDNGEQSDILREVHKSVLDKIKEINIKKRVSKFF
ncbi:MAG: hypothetical protein P1P85_02340 [Patescibacteria group bacterium]|nr:hypothetical protein [Patescibacteria group bacterium]